MARVGAAGPAKTAPAKAEEEGGFPTWAIIAIGGGGAALVLVVVLILVLGKKKPAGAPPAAGAPHVAPGVAKTELFQAPSTTARITGTIGPFQGRDFQVGPAFFIARDPARAQLVIQDSQVSGQHLWIGPAGGRIVARDMGSTNGTYHDNRAGQRITEIPLGEGDVLSLGQTGTVQSVFHA
jgi:hypothetical protein